jgi:hypothetical protein
MKKIVAALLVVALMMSVAGCSAKQKIIGTWEMEASVMGLTVSTSYTFHEDGTGTMSAMLISGLEFTYEVEGNVLTIHSVLGISSTTEYELSFEGDTMTMTSGGESMTLTKVK